MTQNFDNPLDPTVAPARVANDSTSSLLAKSFGIDLRTLALLRICLGIITIVDLVMRSGSLVAHYTDKGVLSTAEAAQIAGGTFSFHLLNGSAWFQAALFILAAIFALFFIVGYRTRIMTIASWVMLVSLDVRNGYILQSSDTLQLTLLFWSIFLPLGARFSVDAALNKTPPESNTYVSIASAALLIQVLAVYFFGALLKTSDAWIPNGDAVFYALNFGAYASALGEWIGQAPRMLLQVSTYFVYYVELIGPLLVLSPFFTVQFRAVIVPLLIMMHIGFAFLLLVGIYPYLSIVSLLVLIPGEFWDAMHEKIHSKERQGVKIYFDEPCEFCKKVCLLLKTFCLLSSTPITPAQSDPAIHALMQKHNSWVVEDYDGKHYVRWEAITLVLRRSVLFFPVAWLFKPGLMQQLGDKIYGLIATNRGFLGKLSQKLLPYRELDTKNTLAASVLVGVLMVLTIYLNTTNVKHFGLPYPNVLAKITNTLFLRQFWTMFAPEPGPTTIWYFIEGKLANGATVDVYNNTFTPPVVERPKDAPGFYHDFRWRKYFQQISYDKQSAKMARYFCYRWNSDNPEDVVTSLTFHQAREVRRVDAENGEVTWKYSSRKMEPVECY